MKTKSSWKRFNPLNIVSGYWICLIFICRHKWISDYKFFIGICFLGDLYHRDYWLQHQIRLNLNKVFFPCVATVILPRTKSTRSVAILLRIIHVWAKLLVQFLSVIQFFRMKLFFDIQIWNIFNQSFDISFWAWVFKLQVKSIKSATVYAFRHRNGLLFFHFLMMLFRSWRGWSFMVI